jgi:two-component system phosphate regulon sensor histidine kinase PhoR
MIRREFVANVSHEVKTPITAIKGSVETLQDAPQCQSSEITRFLDIILRQADRLNAIVEDLLSLARIEQESEREKIEVETARLADLLRAATEACQSKAGAKSIDLQLECDDDLTVRANGQLIEQAVLNLIDNAVKYSPDETRVRIRGEQRDHGAVIEVIDEGVGVEAEHLPRLFERFYRIDKARSRSLGGTGLGLAIVKHITQAHGGGVSVDSTPGRGSTFRIHLPS